MATRSPTEHHNYWGAYASAAVLPNVAGSPTQDGSLEVGDTAYISGSGLYQCDSEGLGAASWSALGGGGGSLIWKWNETDVSQFQIAKDDIGSGGAALSVVNRDWGPVLRLTFPTKASGLITTFVTISDPDLDLSKDANDLIRYEFRFRLVDFSGTLGEWYSMGPAFLCNKLTGANFYGLAMTAQLGSASRLIKVEGGAAALSGTTPNWASADVRGAEFTSEVMAKHPAASAPGFNNVMRNVAVGASQNERPDQPMTDTYYAANVSAFGAGWGSETLDTVGIAWLGAFAGTTAGQTFDVDSVCVLKHPMSL